MIRKLDERLKNFRTGCVVLEKDSKNLIGISIGGGAPHCPVLYLVQVFENGPAYNSGALQPGDEITSINGCHCRGWSRTDLAKYIQSIQAIFIPYSIEFNYCWLFKI
ncbi:hypothetical protein HZS_2948 [Henneguya salminicola]|uniref:PRKCA-binding protein (Trinotate prediction) n=1 Tax=Henneguya salminicola TaxID=69463 RepID=A0A6G3MKE6_HENSL|nr:hypothetical protein HZS_2948 [Henneguya salminicola]